MLPVSTTAAQKINSNGAAKRVVGTVARTVDHWHALLALCALLALDGERYLEERR